jgi:hypothetical protein
MYLKSGSKVAQEGPGLLTRLSSFPVTLKLAGLETTRERTKPGACSLACVVR